jgi:hypothetical protein
VLSRPRELTLGSRLRLAKSLAPPRTPCRGSLELPLFTELPTRGLLGNLLGPGPLEREFPREIPHAVPFLYLCM